MIRPSATTEDEIAKLGRNDPCHCGSGKKYKKCHLAADEAARTEELAATNAAIAEAARAAAEDDPEGEEDKDTGKDGLKPKARDAKKPAHSAPTARKQRRRGIS